MKEIQGKIKFGVIELPEYFEMARISNKNELRIKIGCAWRHIASVSPTAHIIGKLSQITEEQAAEFVRMMTFESDIIGGDQDCYENYLEDDCWYDTAKESLISLLKANDVWIKEWKEKPTGKFIDTYTDTVDWNVGRARIDYNKLPDDLLLIKLT